MRTLRLPARAPRAFAILTAIGVLAVLAIVVLASAANARLTHARAASVGDDSVLSRALHGAAAGAAANGLKLPPGLAPQGVTVSVEPAAGSAPPELFDTRDGDALVLVRAAAARRPAAPVSGLFLVNTKGARTQPVLLELRRTQTKETKTQ